MMYQKIVSFCKKYYLMLLSACVVGFVSVLPILIAKNAIGDEYQGIPFIYQANEDAYIARIREVVDGYWSVGSAFFYEYKDWNPVVPSTGEFIYALPTILFSIPLLTTLIATKFIFPAILFVLVYYCIKRLSSDPASRSTEINAIIGGLLVTLGYDLIDYRSFIRLIQDPSNFMALSVWIRPINPVTGALLIFGFLLLMWSMVSKRSKYAFIPAGLLWALSIGYVFSWTFMLTCVGLLIAVYGYKKDWYLVKKFLLTTLVWLIVTAPYWYSLIHSFSAPGGQEVAARSGMVHTHMPVINKLLLAGTALFIIASLYFRYYKKDKKANEQWWSCVLLLIICWTVFNQQVITGRSIWYHHYVQYTIPVLMVVLMVVMNNWIKPYFFKLWLLLIIILGGSIGVYNFLAVPTAARNYGEFRELQYFAPVFSWIENNAEKDCVVLNQDAPNVKLDTLIPAFTDCNVYTPSWVFDGVPQTRVLHNYLVMLRLRNIEPTNIKSYLEENKTEVLSYFFLNWDQLFYGTGEEYAQKKIDELALVYQDFVKKDFREELEKYKLDYILFVNKPSEKLLNDISNLQLVYSSREYYIYQF